MLSDFLLSNEIFKFVWLQSSDHTTEHTTEHTTSVIAFSDFSGSDFVFQFEIEVLRQK